MTQGLSCALLHFAWVGRLARRSPCAVHTAGCYGKSREFLGAAPFSRSVLFSWRGRPGIHSHPLTSTTNVKHIALSLVLGRVHEGTMYSGCQGILDVLCWLPCPQLVLDCVFHSGPLEGPALHFPRHFQPPQPLSAYLGVDA